MTSAGVSGGLSVGLGLEPQGLAPRLRPTDEADLRWYVTEAEGALGMRSSFGAMVAMLSTGIPQGSASADGAIDAAHRCVEAAQRERRIRDALRAMPRRLVRVLLLRHAPGRAAEWPGALTLGSLAGVALVTQAAKDGRARALAGRRVDRSPEWTIEGWLSGVVKRSRDKKGATAQAELSTLAAIRLEAERLVAEAETAYVVAKVTVARRRPQ